MVGGGRPLILLEILSQTICWNDRWADDTHSHTHIKKLLQQTFFKFKRSALLDEKTAILRLGAPLEGGVGFTGNVRYWYKLYLIMLFILKRQKSLFVNLRL